MKNAERYSVSGTDAYYREDDGNNKRIFKNMREEWKEDRKKGEIKSELVFDVVEPLKYILESTVVKL